MADKELPDEELNEKVREILDSEADENVKIKQLHDLGYSNTQIHQEFGFKKSTVYKVLPVRPVKEKGNDKVTKSKPGHELMKVGSKDIIPPEETFRDIQLQDGDYKRGFVDGIGVLIMAARYNQILAASQSEVLTNQIKIMEESRKGSAEVAQEAAARAAAHVGAEILPRIDALQSQIMAQSQNPMAALMMSMMAPSFQQAGQQFAKVFGATQLGGKNQTGAEKSSEQVAFNPPNIEEHSIKEWEG